MMKVKPWDGLSIAAALLCVVPGVGTTVYIGVPDDLGWELPVVLLFLWSVLAAPQLLMLTFVRAAQSKFLRILFLLASVGLVIAYAGFVPTVNLAGDAQAGLAFPFFQLYMAGAAAIAGGIVLWVHRRFFDEGAES
jgi:hypothetical protein